MKLHVQHAEQLEESGITLDTAKAAGLYSRIKGRHQGLMFPWPDSDYVMVRLDTPGKGPKYLAPKGKPLRLYIPPMLDISDMAKPLLITEGIKKALKAVQEGLPCVALNGVWGWKRRVDEQSSFVIDDFDRIQWKGRTVKIVFDSDRATNADIQRAERALATELIHRGATVFIVPLPEGKAGRKVGLDDYLVAHGAKAFAALAALPVVAGDEDREATDAADAEELAVLVGDRVRYCRDEERWYVFDGIRWIVGTKVRVMPFVQELADERLRKAATEANKDRQRRLVELARRLLSDHTVHAVISMLRAVSRLWIEPKEFDADRFLLNVENGTLDLQTGKLHAHRASDLITKLAPVKYDPDARSPMWEKTINLAACQDQELAAFLQRVIGYALTGDVREDKFFVFYGPTAFNGKSTILGAVAAMLGDYAETLRVQAILAGDDHKIPHELARLRGARMVVTSEVPPGKRFDEETLKLLTGADEITAAFKHQNSFKFWPTLKLFMIANDRPDFSQAEAIWRRPVDVPFNFSFKDYKGLDRDYRERVRSDGAERSAVLAWAVKGCLALQKRWEKKQDIGVPESCRQATAEHRKDVDPVTKFVREACKKSTDMSDFPNMREMYSAYKMWAKEQGVRDRERLTETALSQGLARLGYSMEKMRDRNHNVRNRWAGLTIRDQYAD